LAPSKVSGEKTLVVTKAIPIRVLADPATKHYFRQMCTIPASAVEMLRSDAIAAGYRPDPGCYATRKQ
jgi:hypothetical protein